MTELAVTILTRRLFALSGSTFGPLVVHQSMILLDRTLGEIVTWR